VFQLQSNYRLAHESVVPIETPFLLGMCQPAKKVCHLSFDYKMPMVGHHTERENRQGDTWRRRGIL